jgi:catechol 2,3-dioxygenase-like lactoylglutathione lyase family enzyme
VEGRDGRVARTTPHPQDEGIEGVDDGHDRETAGSAGLVTATDPLLVAIDHVQLGMPAGGEDGARAFYSGVLGLREVPKPPELAGRGGVWFAGGAGVAIHLGVEADPRPPAKAHPAFVVADLGIAREAMIASGHAIEDDDSGLPVARWYVRDPFGNRIELVDARDAGFSER